ncbi:MAG: hypothetical protein ACYCVH_09660 [Ignavibacteriaceae bacterium]
MSRIAIPVLIEPVEIDISPFNVAATFFTSKEIFPSTSFEVPSTSSSAVMLVNVVWFLPLVSLKEKV